uniref:Uncharacterized protein n=1 Tax=Rhizophora mucronata TaxID=61149 RepID=A0A2P2QHE2_RHIMU
MEKYAFLQYTLESWDQLYQFQKLVLFCLLAI